MTPQELHQRATEVFGEVQDRDPAEWATLLDRLCGGNQQLRRYVEDRLPHKVPTLAGQWVVRILPDSSPPEQVGPYRILKELGQGGMGMVYLAQQEEPVRRQVALKLIQAGVGLDEVVRRFQTERHILANLHHPNIATFYDAGTTDDGRQPYFAMEHVEGLTIEEYCDKRRLSIRDRLQLFRKVCSAVELAHRNLVVHRDIKPANILVDETGTPKLLDFGIAKLLQAESGVHTVLATQGSHGPMTVPYASPEMVAGEPVTTASDVYSLGVLLYRLLSGHHPYAVQGLSFVEAARVIRKEDPTRPSTVVGSEERSTDPGTKELLTPGTVADNRGTDPRKLKLRLAGDLDCIVLKALRKQPKDRYGSVAELSEDLRRHLDGLPVLARAGDRWYHAKKYVHRHRWGLAVAASILLLLVGFAVAMTVLYRQTLDERNQARMSRDLFVEILESTNPRNKDENLSVEDVVQRGVDLYDESFRVELRVQANVLDSLGVVYSHRGHYESARPLLEEALRIRLEIFGADHLLVGESLVNLAFLEGEAQNEVALSYSEKGLGILRTHYDESHPELAKATSAYASQLYRFGELDKAEELYLKALAMKRDRYGSDHLSVATSLAVMGTLRLRQGDHESARLYYQEALEIRRSRLPETHPVLASSYYETAMVLATQRHYEEAIPLFRKALEIRMANMGRDHPTVALSRFSLAFYSQRAGQYAEVEDGYRESLRVRCKTYGDDSDRCLSVKKNLALLLATEGEAQGAEELAREVLEAFKRSKPRNDWRIADARSIVGACLVARGRFSEAEALLVESYPVVLEARGENSLSTQDARQRLCDLYEAWQMPEKASEYCQPSPSGTPSG